MSIETKTYVLSSCLEVYNATKEIFPNVKAKVIKESQLQLIFNDNFPPLTLENAVIKNGFKRELSELAISLELSANPYTLKAQDFLLSEPLSGWHELQRKMYERKERKCVDVLTSFLSTSETPITKLEKLGLAPQQVEQGLTEDVRVYFLQLLVEMERRDKPQKDLMIQNLKAHYPNTHQILGTERINRKKAEFPKVENVFEKIAKGLRERVYGQEEAIQQLAALLSRHQNSKKNGCYLFVGPTGVGKTELAKAISAVKGYNFLFLEMQQCSSETGVGKFWGSGPGYVGSTDKPHFMKELDCCKPNKISENGQDYYEIRNAVILFDELEKAHKTVQVSLLTLLDEGSCTFSYTGGSRGNNVECKYRFNNCVFIGTSNLFQTQILQAFQQKSEIATIADLFKELNKCGLVGSYAPELLGRMEIIPFGPLPRGECYQKMIRSKLITLFSELKKSYPFKEIALEKESLLLEGLESKFYGNGTDIRAMKRSLERIVNDIITTYKDTWGDLKEIKLTLSCIDDKLVFQVFFFDDLFGYSCIETYTK